MAIIFIVKDKTKRDVRLTAGRLGHILERHSNVNIELIRNTLENPSFIKHDKFDYLLCYYYKYIKEDNRYLLVAVKYLNGAGFVLTSFYTKRIK